MVGNVLVTGGAGYIGMTLVPHLLDRGDKVTMLDSFMYGVEPILPFVANPNLRIVRGDVRDEALVRSEVGLHDSIVHLAAIVGHPACSRDPAAALTTNFDGALNVCRAVSPDQCLVFASTGSVFGKVDGKCTEETQLAPLTLYGQSKAEAERAMLDVGAVSLRLATAFGLSPRLRMDLLVHDLAYVAQTTRELVLYQAGARRTFLHVRDMARAFLLAMDLRPALQGTATNVGDEALNFTKRELASMISQMTPVRIFEEEGKVDADARDYEVSYAKLRSLGFSAEISLREGIAEILKLGAVLDGPSAWRNA